ncbi:Ig-like domain-containing protein, partial [Vibrio sp. 10N.286.49.E1]|uniref:PKD domain-containing protein n=1 Tax=Vibrio sp. 10N.286.49.E1 TaxID=3229702 RepID=UPI00354DAB06
VSGFAHVEVDIKPVNDAPQLTLDKLEVSSEPGEVVVIKVTNIIDVDSTSHQIVWSQVKGPKLSLKETNTETLSLRVPSDAADGEQYRFTVTVTDLSGAYAKQSVVL